MTELVIRGKAAICQAIGRNKAEFKALLDDGLPAWQEAPNGTWRARPESLREWLKKREQRFLGYCQ